MTNIVVETCFEDLEEARNLGKTLIYEHLVSCVHISEIESIYIWENDYPDVKEYLVSHGISEDRISVISYGKERPAVFGSNEAAWAQNRRAVTVLSSAE